MKKVLAVLLLLTTLLLAEWVQPGQEIEVYDYATGDYSVSEVESVTRIDEETVEVEIYNYTTGDVSYQEITIRSNND